MQGWRGQDALTNRCERGRQRGDTEPHRRTRAVRARPARAYSRRARCASWTRSSTTAVCSAQRQAGVHERRATLERERE